MNAELAAKIANDIAEGIDNRESRAVLRECVAWWANQCSYEAMGRISAQTAYKFAGAIRNLEFEQKASDAEAAVWRTLQNIQLRHSTTPPTKPNP